MISIYLFALVVGGGLLAFSLLGRHDGADDVSHDHNPVEFLSIRTLTYFLFVFGGVGAVLTWAWRGAGLLTAAIAAGAGMAVAATVSTLFSYLRRTDSGGREGDESFQGLMGRVALPLQPNGLGKITVQRGDRSFELLARPLHPDTAADAASWKSVVVVEMSRGTALVEPLDDKALLESTTPFVSQEKQ